jgi:riboflavin synthase
MFTGIVQAVGHIVRVAPHADGTRVTVDAGALGTADIAIGDSIAVNGCCLTAVQRDNGALAFDVSAATLSCTTGLDREGPVNLEKSLRASDRLGGHLVMGHVDGVGVVQAAEPIAGDAHGSVTLTVRAPDALMPLIAPKGSIAVQGVSLTVNAVGRDCFAVNLIPHTLAVTTLRALAAGARVNLEIDVVARYVVRFMQARGADGAPGN